MPHHIRELYLDAISPDFEIVTKGPSERRLQKLSKINLFIGPNNSGKSRFLRELAKLHQLTFVPTVDLKPVKDIRDKLVTDLGKLMHDRGIADINGLKASAAALPSFTSVTNGIAWSASFRGLTEKMSNTVHNGMSVSGLPGRTMFSDSSGLIPPILDMGRIAHGALTEALTPLPKQWDFERIYIPTLRGLRTFESAGDCYGKRTGKDYFTGGEPPKIESGLELYQRICALLLGNLGDRQVVDTFQKFLGRNFFDGADVALIPRQGSDVLYIKIGDEGEQPIFNLGDGIQMIVAITFPLFRAKGKNVLMFIEEPELYLHPGLQRTLINTLASFENAQFFVATHSNHLLDLTLDRGELISVFSAKKELVASEEPEKRAKCLIENLSNNDAQVLSLLGVRNSSVFLSNCTIWVEGITDRRYLRRFLRLYIEREHKLESGDTSKLPFKEDLHYSFVEYGGSNITHWSFLDTTTDPIVVDRLCARLMLIADKDNSPAKDERHAKLAKKLGDHFVLLDRIEIENVISITVLRAILLEYEGAVDHIPDIAYDDYAQTPLGEFIEVKLDKNKKRKGSYQAESGTISDKITFCEKALNQMNAYEDLSPDAQKLAERIYLFIKAQNSS